MKVLNTKTFDELVKESNADLEAAGFSPKPGGIARLFMNIVNSNVANLYSALTVNHLRAFVTTSDGVALDAIGELLQCFRRPNESDDNYRYRISNQCLTLATSNEVAVRLAILSVDDVDDCVVKPFGMGAGSFSIVVLPSATSDTNTVLNNVYNAVNEIHAYGIRFDIATADNSYIKLRQRVILDGNLSDIEKQEARYAAYQAVSEYINSLNIGQSIITDSITQAIMNSHEGIIQEVNDGLWINGEKCPYVNQKPRWRERYVFSLDPDALVIL